MEEPYHYSFSNSKSKSKKEKAEKSEKPEKQGSGVEISEKKSGVVNTTQGNSGSNHASKESCKLGRNTT